MRCLWTAPSRRPSRGKYASGSVAWACANSRPTSSSSPSSRLDSFKHHMGESSEDCNRREKEQKAMRAARLPLCRVLLQLWVICIPVVAITHYLQSLCSLQGPTALLQSSNNESASQRPPVSILDS